MSDSDPEQSASPPADADDSLVESTEVENATEGVDAAKTKQDEHAGNGLDQDDEDAKGTADDEDAEMGDDLFGEDGGDEEEDAEPSKKRKLDDQELDSGDDLDRDDRMVEDDEPTTPVQQEATMAEVEMARHATLKGSDGELYLLHNAGYTGIEPKMFNPKTFAPPVTDHHSQEVPSETFSAAQTSASTIRWRRDPNDSSKMQSNSRIIRWSDGSLTLQMGSDPQHQYELPATSMARKQLNPKKPTPTSKQVKKGAQPTNRKKDDAYTYLTTIDETQGFARVTSHLTAALNVRSTKLNSGNDNSLFKLQQGLLATTAAKRGDTSAGGLAMTNTLEDPELMRKRAEQLEKEKAKMDKQNQARKQREEARRQGVMGRSAGYGRSGGMGLSVAGLEDEPLGGYGAPRKRAPPRKKARRSYDSEEEELGKGHTREDEYDEEDDFIARSDEEEEPEGGDDDEEEELLDEDAEGEEDEAPVQQSVEKGDAASRRRGGRQVVDDDDEE